jgi:hypothetical protein
MKNGRPINPPRRSDGNQEEERIEEEVSREEVVCQKIQREEGWKEEERVEAHAKRRLHEADDPERSACCSGRIESDAAHRSHEETLELHQA